MKPHVAHLVKKNIFIPIYSKFCAQGKIMDCLNIYSLVKFTPL